MLELNRIGDEVYCGDKKLTIVRQASKGEGKEVVKIANLEGSNGQTWISLKRLQEGLNVFNDCDLKKRELSKNYELTDEEQQEVDKLTQEVEERNDRIAEIIEAAKARYVKPVKVKDLTKMSEDKVKKLLEQFGKDKILEMLGM